MLKWEHDTGSLLFICKLLCLPHFPGQEEKDWGKPGERTVERRAFGYAGLLQRLLPAPSLDAVCSQGDKSFVWMLSQNIPIVFRDRNGGSQESHWTNAGSIVWHALRDSSHHGVGSVPSVPQGPSQAPHLAESWKTKVHILHPETQFHFATDGRNIMKFQLLGQCHTKYLWSVNCQANGFPFHVCHNRCLPEMISHAKKWILDLDTVASASFSHGHSEEQYEQRVYWWASLQCHGHSSAGDNSEISFRFHHREREKPSRVFNLPWADGLTLKFLLMAAELNAFRAVIVILWVGLWICLLNFPVRMNKRGHHKCVHYCYGEGDQRQSRSLYARLI